MLQVAVQTAKTCQKTADKHICGYIFNQMTANADIQKHGAAAVQALLKEFAQLEDKKVFTPLDPLQLNK